MALRHRLQYRWHKILTDAKIEHQIDTFFNHVPDTQARRARYIVAFALQDLWLLVLRPLLTHR